MIKRGFKDALDDILDKDQEVSRVHTVLLLCLVEGYLQEGRKLLSVIFGSQDVR